MLYKPGDKQPAEVDQNHNEELALQRPENRRPGLLNFLSALIAIVVGLLVGLIILLFTNPQQAFPGLVTILKGGFTGSATAFGQEIATAVPIIMTGLSIALGQKAGLFNIGASGQFMVGGFCAVFVAIKASAVPDSLLWLVCMLAAAAGAGIWGAVPGLLKAYFKVNEVITCIMMNYIGLYLVKLLIETSIYDSRYARAQNVPPRAQIPTLGLAERFPGTNLNISLLLALIFCVVIYIMVSRTTFGFELNATGKNPDAARYAGINSRRSIVIAMIIAGALAGIGGWMHYCGGSGVYMETNEVLAPQGFSGISVALLGMSNPIAVFFSGLFIGHITIGGEGLQLHGFSKEVIDMIIAVIIYCAAFSLIFKQLIGRLTRNNRRPKKREANRTREVES